MDLFLSSGRSLRDRAALLVGCALVARCHFHLPLLHRVALSAATEPASGRSLARVAGHVRAAPGHALDAASLTAA